MELIEYGCMKCMCWWWFDMIVYLNCDNEEKEWIRVVSVMDKSVIYVTKAQIGVGMCVFGLVRWVIVVVWVVVWIELIWFIVRVDEMDVVDKGFMVVWMKMISLVEVVMRVLMVCVMEVLMMLCLVWWGLIGVLCCLLLISTSHLVFIPLVVMMGVLFHGLRIVKAMEICM